MYVQLSFRGNLSQPQKGQSRKQEAPGTDKDDAMSIMRKAEDAIAELNLTDHIAFR